MFWVAQASWQAVILMHSCPLFSCHCLHFFCHLTLGHGCKSRGRVSTEGPPTMWEHWGLTVGKKLAGAARLARPCL